MLRAVPTTRLYAILARESRRAVVFRRGPTKRVVLVAWDRATDSFTPGHALSGRIYERRSDLSPSGERLVYFAAKWKKPIDSWTAVSKPPWLTALLLWPKGDAWGGGGLFEGENVVRLNHPPSQFALQTGRRLPRRVRVVPIGPWAGRGEDEPILYTRLVRDGWRIVQGGESHWQGLDAPASFVLHPHAIDAHASPDRRWDLVKTLTAVGERQGPWWVEEFAITKRKSGTTTALGRLDWADWDVTGELLFARQGRLFRFRPSVGGDGLDGAKEIADLRETRAVVGPAPKRATEWR